MAASRDKELSLARVYAEAMLAAAAGREQAFVDDLEALTSLLDSEPGFEAVLANPLIDSAGKRALIDKALRGQLSETLVDGLQVMRQKGRLHLVRELAEVVRAIWLERQGKVEVRVASAVALTPALREELSRAVGARPRQVGTEGMLFAAGNDHEIAGQRGSRRRAVSQTFSPATSWFDCRQNITCARSRKYQPLPTMPWSRGRRPVR